MRAISVAGAEKLRVKRDSCGVRCGTTGNVYPARPRGQQRRWRGGRPPVDRPGRRVLLSTSATGRARLRDAFGAQRPVTGPYFNGRDRHGTREVCVRLLIAIPVFNEQKYLGRVLDKVHGFHPDVLVVDDGSTDDTPKILAARGGVAVIRHESNLGYGRSLIDAFAYADREGYDWVITMDCDEQHEPE